MTRVDRRALFASGAAAALLAATGVSLAGAPKRGGHLRIAVPRAASGLAPEASAAVFETLTELTPEGILQGRLATEWRASGDAKTWDLTVRPDVLFHDGMPMTAEDVAASLEQAPVGLPALSRVDVTSDITLQLELTDGDPHLPIRLTDPGCMVRPARDADRDGLIGTGLYAVRHVTAGGGLVAVRVDTHYSAQAGWADRVDIVALSDPRVRSRAFNEGLVDTVLAPDCDSIKLAHGTRCLPADADPVLVARNTVGIPAATTSGDSRMAERFWLI